VRFAGAGFPPVLVYRRGAFSEYASGGPPLGIVAGIAFEQHEVTLNGGAMYAFSDGATDVRNAEGARLGNAGVRELIARHATAAPDARLRALLSDLKHLKLVDDTTLLLVEKPPAHGAHVLLEHHMPARAQYLREMRTALRKLLDQLGIEPALRDRLVLAVDEACTNIIRHAYGGESDAGIGLRVSRADDVLSFELTDDAPCVDPGRMRPKPLGECRAGGLGIALIDTVMDSWHVEPASARCGNRLILRKRVEDKGFG
jgi:sigma-B regulation protein RsbU (phosphoserine phosphatase)